MEGRFQFSVDGVGHRRTADIGERNISVHVVDFQFSRHILHRNVAQVNGAGI